MLNQFVLALIHARAVCRECRCPYAWALSEWELYQFDKLPHKRRSPFPIESELRMERHHSVNKSYLESSSGGFYSFQLSSHLEAHSNAHHIWHSCGSYWFALGISATQVSKFKAVRMCTEYG